MFTSIRNANHSGAGNRGAFSGGPTDESLNPNEKFLAEFW
jgi:hypothetical protein